VPLGEVAGLERGDRVAVAILRSGERGCGHLDRDGKLRAAVASDVGDPTRLLFYRAPGVGFAPAGELPPGVEPIAMLDRVGVEVRFRDRKLAVGAPIEALAEGLGLRRNDPALRRLQSLASVVLDPGDPVAYARNLQREPILFAGQTARPGGHALVITTVGDMNVPASAGLTYGRAAGIIDYRTIDPRYGKPQNQVLLDTYTAEAVHLLGRYRDASGGAVHLDVDDLARGDDPWGASVPRLDPPLRIGIGVPDAAAGMSAAVFPYASAEGRHGMDTPWAMTDQMRKACLDACAQPGEDACGCASRRPFDLGTLMVHMIGGFFASGGTMISDDLCQSREDCPGLPPAPPARTF
jgi:hypothetical protein